MSPKQVSLATTILAGLATACAGGGSTDAVAEHRVDAAAIAALPPQAVTDGALVCTSIGDDRCPLRAPAANRIDAERFALWEPGAVVRVWRANDTLGMPVGRAGGANSQYRLAIAVRADGRGYRLITADSGWRRLAIDANGEVREASPIPVGEETLTAVGYVGGQAVRQEMAGWETATGGRLTLTLLDEATDSVGRRILETAVPWLTGGAAGVPPLPPYVAANPSWALSPGSGLVWSPGGEFLVEFRSLRGTPRWRLRGPPGPAVTARDLAVRDSMVRAASELLPFGEEDFASMRERADSVHPPVSGLTIAPNGEVVVGLAAIPGRDSIDYLRLAPDGVPASRFRLGARDRLLLFEGDSLLVHRPTEGEPWEVRWVVLGR